MNATNGAFLANLLDAAPRSYAQDTVRRMPQVDGSDHRAWVESLIGWIQVLAASLRSGRPGLFASHMSWLRAASEGRAEPPEFLVAGLRALGTALNSSLPEGADGTLKPYLDGADTALTSDRFLPQSPLEDTPFAEEALGLLQDLIRGDARGASGRVRALVQAGRSPTDVIVHLLIPAERELGRLWHVGELTIAEEHFATRVIRRALGDVLATADLDAPTAGCVVLAGAVGDEHDMGLAMLAALFELEGWRAIDLGANVPADELVTSCAHMSADVIVLSASLTTQLQAVTKAIAALRERSPQVRILVGGYAFADSGDLWEQIGADGYGVTMQAAVELAANDLSKKD